MSFANALALVHHVALLRDTEYEEWFTVFIVGFIGGRQPVAKSVAGVCHRRAEGGA
jgi:hypothetical protein